VFVRTKSDWCVHSTTIQNGRALRTQLLVSW